MRLFSRLIDTDSQGVYSDEKEDPVMNYSSAIHWLFPNKDILIANEELFTIEPN